MVLSFSLRALQFSSQKAHPSQSLRAVDDQVVSEGLAWSRGENKVIREQSKLPSWCLLPGFGFGKTVYSSPPQRPWSLLMPGYPKRRGPGCESEPAGSSLCASPKQMAFPCHPHQTTSRNIYLPHSTSLFSLTQRMLRSS